MAILNRQHSPGMASWRGMWLLLPAPGSAPAIVLNFEDGQVKNRWDKGMGTEPRGRRLHRGPITFWGHWNAPTLH